MKKLLLLLLAFITCHCTMAQYNAPQNNIWAMGKNSGISFVGSNPVVINTNFEISYASSYEGCASISDGSNLLFYTNGTTIWNSQGQVMPHGAMINGNGVLNISASSSQGALIVPIPGTTEGSRFYLFTMTSYERGKLYCNVVDLSLGGGLGDIDTTFYLHKVVLDSLLAEKLIAIPGCNNDIWVLVHKQTSNVFQAYNITDTGINLNPVISTTGNAFYYAIGAMKVSPAYDKIAVCAKPFQLFDFDNATGTVSNAYVLDTVPYAGYYGCAFSPDGSKLYGKEYGGVDPIPDTVNQFDLNATNPMATKTQLGFMSPNLTDMQLAPDGRIYFASIVGYTYANRAKYAGRINNPNNTGTACGFQDSVTALFFPNSFVGGLPNTVMLPTYLPPAIPGSIIDSLVCNFPGSGITLHAPAGHTSYVWDNGTSGSTRQISQAGIYWVKYKAGPCGYTTDSFRISSQMPTPVIAYENGVLRTTLTYTTYQWYKAGLIINGATNQYCGVSGDGWYSVKVTGPGGCTDSVAYEVTGSTGITDPDVLKDQISIYPNPATHTVSVKAPVPVSVSLYSIEGRLLSGQQHQSSIDVRNIAEGLYFIQVRSKEGQLLKVEKLWVRHQAE